LGPYQGRSPDLISQLRGVLTNPNCEYGANFVAIHTLAQWSKCTSDPPLITHDSKYKIMLVQDLIKLRQYSSIFNFTKLFIILIWIYKI